MEHAIRKTPCRGSVASSHSLKTIANVNARNTYQLDFQDINMLSSPPRFNIEPVPTPTPTSTTSQRQWLHLQPGTGGETQKKRRILQPHSHNQYQQSQLRPHSGNPSQTAQSNHHNSHYNNTRKPSPPALMIPFFEKRDPELSSTPTLDEYDSVSPRTMTISPREVSLPPPVLRPCHVCHRKPSTKVMLDAYADCELCEQRACYICLRACNSLNCSTTRTEHEYDDSMRCADIRREDGYLHTRPHPHSRIRGENGTERVMSSHQQRKICSCCAVEGLTDTGEEIVWCLDCVRREETSHQMWQ
jgi:hypothetical protein